MCRLRYSPLIGIVVLAATLGSATTITLKPIQDGLGTGVYDTIGPESIYAAVSGSITINGGGHTDVVLNFNYGGTTLAPFTDPTSGVKLEVGDLLLEIGTSQYGIPLISHNRTPGNSINPFQAGHLYQNLEFPPGTVANPYQTAQAILQADNPLVNLSNYPFRPLMPVWIGNGADDTGTIFLVSISPKGATTPEFTVTMSGTLPSDLVNEFNAGHFTVLFSAETCANGVLRGDPPPTPEPGSWLLLASGSLAMLLGHLWNHFNPLLCRPAKAMN